MPNASGTAMISARIEVTIVPKIGTAAPNISCTGSQSSETRKPRPNRPERRQAADEQRHDDGAQQHQHEDAG